MSSEASRIQAAEEIFVEVLEVAPEARQELLRERCQDDTDLRRRVESLLADADDADSFFDDIATPHLSSKSLADQPLQVPATERYNPEGEIGRGGMAVVVKVRDQDLNRQLAMKVLQDPAARRGSSRRDSDSTMSSLRARFLEEAQVTAQLEHPGIVPIHEMGEHDDGSIFFTMPLVRGRELEAIFALARAGKEDWNLSRAVGVLIKACQAVAYAHSKGVIHRDLKPRNIMVGRFGEVYVMDWGLAKVSGQQDLHERKLTEAAPAIRSHRQGDSSTTLHAALLTQDGAIVGTPAVMPPEQAAGRVDQVDERSDVYALGAILYSLLAGQLPYLVPGKQLSAPAVLKLVKRGPPAPIPDIDASAPVELVAICDKAMARERRDRYPSSSELAEDLQAWIDGRVVAAYESGSTAEFRKWVARNKPLTLALGAAVMLLVLGAAASLWQAGRATQSALEAQAARVEAEASLVDMYTAYGLQSADRGDQRQATLWFAKAAASAEPGREQQVHRERVVRFSQQLAQPIAAIAESRSARAHLSVHPGTGRYLLSNHLLEARAELWDHVEQKALPLPRAYSGEASPSAAAWSPDGALLALANQAGVIQLFTFPEMEPSGDGGGVDLEQSVTHLVFSADGQALAVAGSEGVACWRLADASATLTRSRLDRPAASLTFDPSGRYLALGDQGHLASVFQVGQLGAGPLFKAAHNTVDAWHHPAPQFDAAGERMVTRAEHKVLQWWALPSGEKLERVDTGDWILDLKSHPADDRLYVMNGAIQSYRLSTGEKLTQGDPFPRPCFAWGVSADFTRAIVGGSAAESYLYDLRSDSLSAVLGPTGVNGFRAFAFSDEGETVITSAGHLAVWKLPSIEHQDLKPVNNASSAISENPAYYLELSAEGTRTRRVALATSEAAGEWMDLPATGDLLEATLTPDGSIAYLTFSAGAKPGCRIIAYDAVTGQQQTNTTIDRAPFAVVSGFDPRLLAVGFVESSQEVILVDGAVGRVRHRWQIPKALTPILIFSPDASILFCHGLADLHAWNTDTGERIETLHQPELRGLLGMTFSPDGKWAACGGSGREVVILDWQRRAIVRKWSLPNWLYTVRFSPDGSRLVTLSKDHFVRVWDCQTGEILGSPFAMRRIGKLAFDQFGERIVTLQSTGQLDLWDWRKGRRLAPTRQLALGEPVVNDPDEGTELGIHADHGLAGTSHSGHYRFRVSVRAGPQKDPESLLRWVELISHQRITENGDVEILTNAEWLERWQTQNLRFSR